MAKLVLPRVHAMVVCDALKESDDEPGVFHLHSVRSGMIVPSFPAFLPRVCVFLQMSGHAGSATCHIEIESAEQGDLIFHTAAKEIYFESPTSVKPIFFRLRNCVLPEAGVNYVQIVDDGKVIGERRLQVRLEA